MTNKLYVANIPFRANEDDVEAFFKESGEVNQVRLVYGDRGHKGFGFVEMVDHETAKKALDELNGATMMDRPLLVDYAKERSERAPRPSGNHGWGQSNPRGGYGRQY